MTKLDSCPEALGPFDLIYCIGNSIVHLPDRESVSIALASCRDRLIPHGAVVIQIINFELVKNGAVPELPPLHSNDRRVVFDRDYVVSADRASVSFVTRLSVDGRSVHDDSIPLLAITREELESMLESAGFREIVFTGGFDESDWTAESFVTIVTAR